MFKKIMAYALMLGVIILINPIAAVEVVQNGSATETFNMTHTVARVSKFSAVVEKSTIDGSGETKLGSFSVKNNTKDGFSLTIASTQGGVLQPTATDDGETAIEYDVSLIKTGTTGIGLDEKLTHSSVELATAQAALSNSPILSMAGSAVSSETNASYDLIITIDDAESDTMAMAGTYDDVLTLVYTDL